MYTLYKVRFAELDQLKEAEVLRLNFQYTVEQSHLHYSNPCISQKDESLRDGRHRAGKEG